MELLLGRNWWLLALRGILAIIFGLIILFAPDTSLLVLVLFFGGFALADGIFSIIAGAYAPKEFKRWWWLIIGGILSILLGIVSFFYPLATAFGILIWLAAWAIVIGVTQIISAIRLRKEIEGEVWLILGGILSVLFGIFAFVYPWAGILAVTLTIGIYAIAFGIIMLIAAFRVRKFFKAFQS